MNTNKLILKKYFNGVFVALMIIGFPFLSWYYLTGGIEYRKTALKELENKVIFNEKDLLDSSHHALIGKLLLVDINGSTVSYEKLFNQFNKAPEFNIISHNVDKGYSALSEEEVKKLETKYAGTNFLLIDAEGMERRRYKDTNDDMLLLVKHIATLLPVNEKKKDKNNSKSEKK
jgi:hypothetical protein